MSVSYFVLRCIYSMYNRLHRHLFDTNLITVVWMYIKITDQKKSYWRSIVYWASNCAYYGIDSLTDIRNAVACFLTTFVKCGLKLNAGY